MTIALAACGGGDDAVTIDAAAETDAEPAGPDATPGVACASGGEATVSYDPGGNAAPVDFVAAWWDTGHLSKSCFEISVALSTTDTLPDPYYGAAGVLEVWFFTEPVLGENAVQAHLHDPDTYIGGTVTLTTLSDTEVAGTLDANDGPRSVIGTFSAARCAAIFDPCI